MDIKDYLKSFSRREFEIVRMKEQLSLLRSMAEGGSSPKTDDKPRGMRPMGSTMENFICKAIDLEGVIREREKELEKDKSIILKALATLPSAEHEKVIIERYFNRLSWNDVAAKIGRSPSWVFKAHGEALEELRLRLEVVA